MYNSKLKRQLERASSLVTCICGDATSAEPHVPFQPSFRAQNLSFASPPTLLYARFLSLFAAIGRVKNIW